MVFSGVQFDLLWATLFEHSCSMSPYINLRYFLFGLHSVWYLDNLIFSPPTKKLRLGFRIFTCTVSQYLSWILLKCLLCSLSGSSTRETGDSDLEFSFLASCPTLVPSSSFQLQTSTPACCYISFPTAGASFPSHCPKDLGFRIASFDGFKSKEPNSFEDKVENW